MFRVSTQYSKFPPNIRSSRPMFKVSTQFSEFPPNVYSFHPILTQFPPNVQSFRQMFIVSAQCSEFSPNVQSLCPMFTFPWNFSVLSMAKSHMTILIFVELEAVSFSLDRHIQQKSGALHLVNIDLGSSLFYSFKLLEIIGNTITQSPEKPLISQNC